MYIARNLAKGFGVSFGMAAYWRRLEVQERRDQMRGNGSHGDDGRLFMERMIVSRQVVMFGVPIRRLVSASDYHRLSQCLAVPCRAYFIFKKQTPLQPSFRHHPHFAFQLHPAASLP